MVSETVDASCHCGAVAMAMPRPLEVTSCNCSICRRYGVLCAYYRPDQVRFGPAMPQTDIYMWDDRSIRFHRCQTCGCVTHWSAVDSGAGRMGINARLLPLDILAQARVRRLDGAGTERYVDD